MLVSLTILLTFCKMLQKFLDVAKFHFLEMLEKNLNLFPLM
jgi:hypothetical protein